MTYFTKHYHPPGTSPGTLIQRDKQRRAPLTILLTYYTDSEYSERLLTEPEECAAYLERETVTWIHVVSNNQEFILQAILPTLGKPDP